MYWIIDFIATLLNKDEWKCINALFNQLNFRLQRTLIMPKYTSSRDYDDESDGNHYGSADDDYESGDGDNESGDGDNESADGDNESPDDVVLPDPGCPVAKLLCWLVSLFIQWRLRPLEASSGTLTC